MIRVIRPEALNLKEPWGQILNQLIIDEWN